MDIIPEIMDGKNVADFIDPDIAEKLDALEREEEKLQAEGFYDSDSDIVCSFLELHIIFADDCFSSILTTSARRRRQQLPCHIKSSRRASRNRRRTNLAFPVLLV